MKTIKNNLLTLAALLVAPALYASPALSDTGTPAPVQGKDDPYNLPLAGPVMQAGSTAASQNFDTTVMPSFLIANGANGGSQVISANAALNTDGFSQHVAEFTTHIFAVPQLNSPYLFLSFEDLWGGGDKDVNDTIIAVNVGAATVNALLATPEPAMPLTFAACLGLALVAVRKNKKAATTV